MNSTRTLRLNHLKQVITPVIRWCLWGSAWLLGAGSAHAQGAHLQVLASGLNQPMVVTSAAGDARLFVAEKGGVIRSIDPSTGQSSVFLDISAKVATQGERGLLGLTFDPNFSQNGRFYLNYSEISNGNTVIERYQASGPGLASASPSSAQTVMTIVQPAGETSHKAGWIGFRPGEPDNLYIATGDGAWHRTIADPYHTGQDLASNLGKMLRIDVTRDDFPGDSTRNYAIPASNPWADGNGANPEIWAYGLRNPFRASFDRQTGDLWIADVGFTQWDEVNFWAASSAGGANFGWNVREGNSGPDLPNAIDPIFNTPAGSGAAIIGGVMYRGSINALNGRYVFADFVTHQLRSLGWDGNQVTDVQDHTSAWLNGLGSVAVSSFGEDSLGNLYLTDLVNGQLLMLVSSVPEPDPGLLLGSALALLAAAGRRGRLTPSHTLPA